MDSCLEGEGEGEQESVSAHRVYENIDPNNINPI